MINHWLTIVVGCVLTVNNTVSSLYIIYIMLNDRELSIIEKSVSCDSPAVKSFSLEIEIIHCKAMSNTYIQCFALRESAWA